MTEGKKKISDPAADSGSVSSDSLYRKGEIERRVEDLFRKFESKPDDAPKQQEIIDDIPDIQIESAGMGSETPIAVRVTPATRTETDTPDFTPAKIRPKIFRPIYVAGAVLVVAAVLTFVTLKPQQAPAPAKPELTETRHKIVQPVTQSRNEAPARQTPAVDRNPDEIRAFLMKWKTAWENTAGKSGDLDAFMSFYSENFTSQGMTKERWRTDKAQKNGLKEWIRLELKDIRIASPSTDNRVEVGFLLDYDSSNYSDETFQMLLLIKEAGKWKIIGMKSAD